jgi:hypothetical protein
MPVNAHVTKTKYDPDAQWFAEHLDRRAHIRNPVKLLHIDKQRHTFYVDECLTEFESLGAHNKNRRRILLWKVPHDNPYYLADRPPILKIPMLAFADETIEDTDAVLLPIIHDLMVGRQGRLTRWAF